MVSQYLGAKKLSEIKSLVPQTILLSFILSAVVYLTTSLLATHIFRLYNASGLILNYAVDYFQIRAFGFPFTLVTFAIFGVLRGLQDTLYAMYISLAGGIINLVLDVVLVFGVGEIIPPMGVEGAAYASLMAQFAMTLAAVWVLHARTPFSFRLSRTLHPELRRILSLSANLVVRTAALNVALYLANRYATGYGKEHIATHTIALNIWLFAAFFIDGYANAGIAIAGKLLGAKEHMALGRLGYDLSRYSVIVALCVSLFFVGAYPWLGGLFIKDAAVLSLFSGMFWMIILMQPLNALAFTFDGIYKGLGEAKFLRNLPLRHLRRLCPRHYAL